MADEGQVNAVALKLPPFWTHFPEAWFMNIESQFNTRNIVTEATKYDYVVQSLPVEIVSLVFDVLTTSNNSQTPYTDLKRALIDRNTISKSKRIEQLLSGEEIGDRKPSDFYRRLKTLAGDSTLVIDQLIIELWTRRLPKLVLALLKSSGKTDIKDLLVVADSVQQQSMNVSAISSTPPSTPSSFPLNSTVYESAVQNQHLHADISEIKNMLSKLSLNDHHSRSRNRSPSRGRRNRSQSRNRKISYNHLRFGNGAYICSDSCNFTKNPN